MADRGEKKDGVAELLREAMRSYPQGVTVITTRHDGRLYGMTASSFISVSIDPPLVLVSMMKRSVTYQAFSKATSFAVNFLADDQTSVSDRFAGRHTVAERFTGLKHHADVTGSPIIDGVISYLDCRKYGEFEAGDHALELGQVLSGRKLAKKSPLVYYSQQYTTVQPPDRSAPQMDFYW